MFERLTASSPRIRSRPYAVVLAVGAHAALGLLAARSTGLAMSTPPLRGVIVFDPYVEPRPVTPPTGAGPVGGGTRPPTSPPPAPTFRVPLTDGVVGPLPVPTIPLDGGGALDSLRRVIGGPGGTPSKAGGALTSEALDVEPPRLLAMPEPRYPAALRDAGVEGRVELEFVVEVAGRVDSASVVVRSAGAEPFVAAARAAILAARFAPARLRGVPVAARARQAVVFRITPGR
jgi:TonB family protein